MMENATFTLAQELLQIPSGSGSEQAIADMLVQRLSQRFSVTKQPVQDGRYNVIATCGEPRVIFNIHLDTVPDDLPVKQEKGKLYGRGAVDAKGPLACMIVACERAHDEGLEGFGLYLDVGEETDFCGIEKLMELAPQAELIVIGEPTGLRPVIAQKGLLEMTVHSQGIAAHSAMTNGSCAIEKLLDVLAQIRALSLSDDPLLGATTRTINLIKGGRAINMVASSAQATISFRTVPGDEGLKDKILAMAKVNIINEFMPCKGELSPIVTNALESLSLPSRALATPFFTELYHWSKKGPALLLGPGDPYLAHTDDEHIRIEDLEMGTRVYMQILSKKFKGDQTTR